MTDNDIIHTNLKILTKYLIDKKAGIKTDKYQHMWQNLSVKHLIQMTTNYLPER